MAKITPKQKTQAEKAANITLPLRRGMKPGRPAALTNHYSNGQLGIRAIARDLRFKNEHEDTPEITLHVHALGFMNTVWGAPSSTEDWCEVHYARVFWNGTDITTIALNGALGLREKLEDKLEDRYAPQWWYHNVPLTDQLVFEPVERPYMLETTVTFKDGFEGRFTMHVTELGARVDKEYIQGLDYLSQLCINDVPVLGNPIFSEKYQKEYFEYCFDVVTKNHWGFELEGMHQPCDFSPAPFLAKIKAAENNQSIAA